MKIGDRVWVRVGLDRRPICGTLISIDLASESGEVWLSGGVVCRAMKRIPSSRPKSIRDKLEKPWTAIAIPKLYRPQ